MERCSVVAKCDNEVVAVILNSRYSKDIHLMHMLRTLFFIEALHQFKITARHIPGTLNTMNLKSFTIIILLTVTPHVFPITFYSGSWTREWTGRQITGPGSSALLSTRDSNFNSKDLSIST